MKKVLRDFYRAEVLGLLKLLLPMAVLLFLLPLPRRALLLLPALALLLLLRMVTQSTAGFRRAYHSLPPLEQERLEQYCRQPHPCYPVYQGELHLLPGCLLGRSRRTLLLIPVDGLKQVRLLQRSGRNALIQELYLTTQSGKTHSIEFLGSQREGAPAVLAWLRSQSPQLPIAEK